MVCCFLGARGQWPADAPIPAAREPAYRPPPRPLSRSSSRNIATHCISRATAARRGASQGRRRRWTPASQRALPPTGLRSDEGATKEGGGMKGDGEVGGARRRGG